MIAEILITPELIIAATGVLCTLVMTVIAVRKHIKAGNWEAAAGEISKSVDSLKKILPRKRRQPILKDLGLRLGSRKGLLDDKLKSLGLDSKS